MSVIETVEQLETIYGFPNDASTVKVADHVTPLYRVLIEKSPFVSLATSGPEGPVVRCAARFTDPRLQTAVSASEVTWRISVHRLDR